MEVITMESEVFQAIRDELLEIKKKVDDFKKKSETPLSEKWLNSTEVCQLLHISKRTLQNLRDRKVLKFSKIGAKAYYRVSDIDQMLNMHYK